MSSPAFVILNGTRIRVHGWREVDGGIAFGTVIRGDAAASDLARGIESDPAMLEIDGQEAMMGRSRLVNHRASGEGPTAIHRLDVMFKPVSQTPHADLTVEEMLELVLTELRAIRREIAELRFERAGRMSSSPSPGIATTMLDFEIQTEE